MTLSKAPDALWGEIRAALDARDQFLGEPYWETIRRFYGPAYRSTDRTVIDFENHAHAWISVFLPALASGNPRVRSKTPRVGPIGAFSKAVELAQNRNFELTDIKRTIEQLATDWAFKYAVSITMPMPVPGLMEREDPRHRPTTKRLPLEDYIWDPLAKQHAEARFQGHRIIRDREDLLREAEEFPDRGWDPSVIASLGESKGREREANRLPTRPLRDEIEYWEVWIPEVTLPEAYSASGTAYAPSPEEGFNGTIFSVTQEGLIRDPRPFWGPRDGAYTFGGYLYVPDEAVPLSPLVATAAQAEIYNSVMASAIENIRGYKRGLAIGSDSGNLDELLADFNDKGIFKVDAIEKLENSLKEIELLGLTPQHQAQIVLLRDILERSSGISEALQGQVSGATATESSIASMASGRRMGYMTEKFISGMVKQIAMKESWYLTADPRSTGELGDLAEGMFVDPKTGQPIEAPVLVGGVEHLDLLEAHDIEIQPISMRFTTEMLEAERAASWEQFLLAVAPMIPATPYIDWALVFSRKAEQLGDPSLARTVDVEKGMMMGQLQMMMQMGQPMPGLAASQSHTQPRLGIDVQKPKMKTSEKPAGFSGNARSSAAASGQKNKGPRQPGTSSKTR